MNLNLRKIQCLLIDPGFERALTVYINTKMPIFSGLKFTQALLLLGVFLGPGASSSQWKRAMVNMSKACDRVCSLKLGSAASIPLFNSLVVSMAAWLASLTPQLISVTSFLLNY